MTSAIALLISLMFSSQPTTTTITQPTNTTTTQSATTTSQTNAIGWDDRD